MNKYLIMFIIVCLCFSLVYTYDYYRTVDVIANFISKIGNTANEIFTLGQYRPSDIIGYYDIDYYDFGIFEANSGRIYSINDIIRDKILPKWYDINQSNFRCTAKIYQKFLDIESYQLGTFGRKKNINVYTDCIGMVLDIEWNDSVSGHSADQIHNISYELIFSSKLRGFYFALLEYDGSRFDVYAYQLGMYKDFEDITSYPSTFISLQQNIVDNFYYLNVNIYEGINNNKDMYQYVTNVIVG